MRIKYIKDLICMCILIIISLFFYSCEESDSADDIEITVYIDDSDIENVQVYTVNEWKYVEDDSSVTVEKYFEMKFIQVEDSTIYYYYFPELIATAEGNEFTIEDLYTTDGETTVQVWRSNRTEAFEVTPDELDYYKITFDSDVTSLGDISYESPYVDITSPNRVDYNEEQDWTYDVVDYDSDDENYFGNWDWSDSSNPVLNEYTDIEIYIDSTTYTITSAALTVSTSSAVEFADLVVK